LLCVRRMRLIFFLSLDVLWTPLMVSKSLEGDFTCPFFETDFHFKIFQKQNPENIHPSLLRAVALSWIYLVQALLLTSCWGIMFFRPRLDFFCCSSNFFCCAVWTACVCQLGGERPLGWILSFLSSLRAFSPNTRFRLLFFFFFPFFLSSDVIVPVSPQGFLSPPSPSNFSRYTLFFLHRSVALIRFFCAGSVQGQPLHARRIRPPVDLPLCVFSSGRNPLGRLLGCFILWVAMPPRTL